MSGQPTGEPGRRRPRAEGLLGGAAQPSPARPPRPASAAPRALRRAALVVGLETLGLAAVAVVLVVLVVAGNATDVTGALGEAVFVAIIAAALGVAGRGLWRGASWSRGPVVALQLFLAVIGFSFAFQGDQPAIGVPILVLVLAELYLLLTPEARLAFAEQHPGDR
ncbi:hypothetical protein [Modestobacter sp. NPDC049651]|uniref:hypothetical protein n=1 Tax=unclassified Modestobacter TaxID=2643866 RepID=UPI0033DF73DA